MATNNPITVNEYVLGLTGEVQFNRTWIKQNKIKTDATLESLKTDYFTDVQTADKLPAAFDLSNVSVDALKAALQRAGVDLGSFKHSLGTGVATPPTTRPDGSPLQEGDFYLDTQGVTHLWIGGAFVTPPMPTVDLTHYLTDSQLDAKYVQRTTYDTAMAGKVASVTFTNEINGLKTQLGNKIEADYITQHVVPILNDKANQASTYTKTDVDGLLANKANNLINDTKSLNDLKLDAIASTGGRR